MQSESQRPILKANLEKIIVKVPLLQVSGSNQGFEDTPIPILSNIGGVISAKHRDKGIGQSLFLEISGLPENSKIIKLITDQDGFKKYSSPLNFNENGFLDTNLRLPYEKWEDLYILMPNNLNGVLEFDVKAISVGGEELEEKSTQNIKVRSILTPVTVSYTHLDAADE